MRSRLLRRKRERNWSCLRSWLELTREGSRNDGHQQVFGLDVLAVGDEDFSDAAGNRGVDVGLHFHGFESEKLCAAFYGLIGLDGDAGDYAGGGSADLAGIGGIGFWMRALDDAEGAIADVDFARLAIQLEKEGAGAVGMRIAAGQELDD